MHDTAQQSTLTSGSAPQSGSAIGTAGPCTEYYWTAVAGRTSYWTLAWSSSEKYVEAAAKQLRWRPHLAYHTWSQVHYVLRSTAVHIHEGS